MSSAMSAAGTPQLDVFEGAAELADAVAEAIRFSSTAAVAARGRFTIALSGGSTPRAVYERLARDARLPWPQIEFCFGDERAVPPDHPDSNARMAAQSLFASGRARPEQVHRIEAELPPAEAAARYETTLRAVFPGAGLPCFDLMLLGLGPDGHTASLFPGTAALSETTRWVTDNWVAKLNTARITLTFPVLNASAEVLCVVSGAEKANALRDVLADAGDVRTTPARGVRPRPGSLRFMVDRAAAAALGRS